METQHPEHVVPSAIMSGPELYAIMAAGYQPLGAVIGVAAVSMGSRGFGRTIRSIFFKGEMSALSETATDARRLAVARAEKDAKALGADLFIVDDITVRDLAEIVEVTCMGTALRKVSDMRVMQMATATN